MASLTISLDEDYKVELGEGECLLLDPKLPRKHNDPSGSFQEDSQYSPRNLWDLSLLLAPQKAVDLHRVYREFIRRLQSQENCSLTVVDTTGIALDPDTAFTAWFEKPPEYFEEGCYVRVALKLREYDADGSDGLLNGSLTLSIGGASVTLLQKYMEEKFPRTFAEDTIPKVDYLILGGTAITGRLFSGKNVWQIVYNANAAEKNAIEAIRAAHNASGARPLPLISVVDSTLGGNFSASVIMTQFPQYQYNKESKDRIYRVQFGLQQA